MAQTPANGQIVCSTDSEHRFNGNETLHVKVIDASRMDAPSITIGEQTLQLSAGQSFPIQFELTYDESRVGRGPRGRNITASIRDENNELLFWSDVSTEAGEGIDLSVKKI